MKSQVKLLYELSFLCSHLSNNIRTFVIAPIILGERKEITCFVCMYTGLDLLLNSEEKKDEHNEII